MTESSRVRTDIGHSTVERIHVRGHDLADELIGKIDFVDMFMLAHSGRRCTDGQRAAINAILVALMDHGFTPSSIAARMTFLGAPEAPQAAVAAGLLGAGSVFLGAMDNAAQMLSEAARPLTDDAADAEIEAVAAALYEQRKARKEPLFGFGHNLHVNGDPRIPALRDVSVQHGCFGKHWRVMLALEAHCLSARGRPLPMNAAGAVAAMICDMGLPLDLARGLALIARSAGIVAHLNEERQAPVGKALWNLVLQQDERNVLPEQAGRRAAATGEE